jgi:putative transposase
VTKTTTINRFINFDKLFVKGKRKTYSRIDIIRDVIHLVKSGCSWVDYTPRYGVPMSTLKYHFYKWRDAEVLDELLIGINKVLRQAKGLPANPTFLILDSSSIDDANSNEIKGYDGHKKVKGIKRFFLVDELGLVWGVHVVAANTAEVNGAKLFCNKEYIKTVPMVKLIIADKGYISKSLAKEFLKFRITFKAMNKIKSIKNKSDHKIAVETHTKRLSIAEYENKLISKDRWQVEGTFAWSLNYRRLIRNFEKTKSSSRTWIIIFGISLSLKKIDKVVTQDVKDKRNSFHEYDLYKDKNNIYANKFDNNITRMTICDDR